MLSCIGTEPLAAIPWLFIFHPGYLASFTVIHILTHRTGKFLNIQKQNHIFLRHINWLHHPTGQNR